MLAGRFQYFYSNQETINSPPVEGRANESWRGGFNIFNQTNKRKIFVGTFKHSEIQAQKEKHMPIQIQFRRGTSAEHETFTGAPGEITVDTTNNTLRVHDGQTTGGTTLARADAVTDMTGTDYVVAWQSPTADNNYTWYRLYKSGWVEMGGMIPKNAGTTSVITNFPLSFSITPNVILTKVIDTAVTEQNSIVVRAVSLDKFTINKLTTNNAVYWYACGISE